jgi:hypothetical protein
VAATAALIKAQWWRLYQGSPLYSMQVKKIIENSAEDTIFVVGGYNLERTALWLW